MTTLRKIYIGHRECLILYIVLNSGHMLRFFYFTVEKYVLYLVGYLRELIEFRKDRFEFLIEFKELIEFL